MARRAVGQHPADRRLVGAAGKLAAGHGADDDPPPAYFQQVARRRALTGQNDVVDSYRRQATSRSSSVWPARRRRGANRRRTARPTSGTVPVAQHHGRIGLELSVAQGPQQRQRRHAVGRANGQPRPRRATLGRPDANRQLFAAPTSASVCSAAPIARPQFDAQQHREQALLVVVVH